MSKWTQACNDTEVDEYAAPAVEVLGTIVEMTAGGGGSGADSCNGVTISLSEFRAPPL